MRCGPVRVVHGFAATMQQELHRIREAAWTARRMRKRTRRKKSTLRVLFPVICRWLADCDCNGAVKLADVVTDRRLSSFDAFSGSPARPSTRSRNSLPGLKCGTNFSGTSTFSPDFGLRPTRDGRRLRPKLPKPRISMRWPLAKASDIASSIVFTAKSASLRTSCGNRVASWATNSDLVILQQYR